MSEEFWKMKCDEDVIEFNKSKTFFLKKIESLEQQNRELKEAAEMEFQRAEGKEEMKRWFQTELIKKDFVIDEATRILEFTISGHNLNNPPCESCILKIKEFLTKIR